MPNKIDNGLKWLWVAVIVIVLDQVTKLWVLSYVDPFSSIEIFPFFNLLLTFNKGAAFSFLSEHDAWSNDLFVVIAVLVSLLILLMLKRMPAARFWGGVGYVLVLGGALGNVIDRVRLGFVVDFLDFHIAIYHWPAFNIADSAICIGVVFLILDLFKPIK